MLPKNYEKKSFLRFDISVSIKKLQKEFDTISKKDWATSYWGNVHCSVGMLLLRGGNIGTSEDFFSEKVYDSEVLDQLPYMKYLLSKEGPFGDVRYAFMFKTEPNGITMLHQDIMDEWKDLYRVHIPIYTNPGAYLIANNLSQHYSEGYAWTFDNESNHGVVNGDEERVHLIFDVTYSSKMKALIDSSEYFVGKLIPENNNKIVNQSKKVNSYLGDTKMIDAIKTLSQRGIEYDDMARFFNSKNIPSKTYPVKEWDANMIQELVPR